MTDPKQPTPEQPPKHCFDELLDAPCANPRYGDLTVREAFMKLLRPRRDFPKSDQPGGKLQFEL